MANRDLNDVPQILEDALFDDGNSVRLNVNGRFRQLVTTLFRNALSKAMLHAEDRDPADSELVAGLTQYWINTDSGARFISVAGADWVDVTPAGTNSQGNDGDDGWTPLFSIASDNDRRVMKIVDWTGGGGDKPDINQYLTATGFDTDIANAVDIRGIQGLQGIQGNLGNSAWTPVFAIESDEARRVVKVVNWTGGGGTKPDINQYLGENGFTTDLALAIDIRGEGVDALTTVATDDTIQGDGTTESPLGVVPNNPSGEIGRIFSIGAWTFGASTTPASGNAGSGSNALYVHTTTGSSVDASSVLETLEEGDYLYVGSDAILEITAAPTEASSIYTFAVNVLQGEVPTSGSHTLYYITEERALIAGAVHGFNIANGAVTLAKLAADVLSNWLSAVATDDTIDGDGTTESPLRVVAPATDNTPVEVETGVYTTFGSWTWTSTSAPATGEVYVESGQIKLFETDADSTDQSTPLGDLGIGDRLQFGYLNAFEITAAGVRSGNGIWTFTGSWSEVFSVGDFDGTYTVRHIKKSNVLVRNIATPGRHLKLSDGLMVETNDPDGDFETLWSGNFNQDSTGSQSLNAGKKFSDYTVLVVKYIGYNSRHEQWFRQNAWETRGHIEVGTEGSKRMSLDRDSDTAFSKRAVNGNIIITGIRGHRGL